MSEFCVRMDPLNPGQFFACCGLLELIELEKPGSLARFILDSARPRGAQFVVSDSVDLKEILRRLRSAKPEFVDGENEPPVPIRPAKLAYVGHTILLDWWLDEFRQETVPLKCWAGQVTTEKLFSELLPMLDENSSGEDLFERRRMTKSKFGVDPRSAWNALDFGFSPDKHGTDATTFPAVDIFAAIGLQGFRPVFHPRGARRVAYHLWQNRLPPSVARVAFRSPWPGLTTRGYEFSIDKRGQSYKYFTFGSELGKESTE